MHTLSELNREFAARGYYSKPLGRHLAELATLLAMSLGGTALFALAAGAIPRGAGLLVMAMGNLGLTTFTHSASHYALSPKRWINRALTFFGYGIIFGTSTTWWWNKHGVIHHTTPNVIGLDDDVDLLPWFALTEDEFAAGSPLQRAYYRRQWMVLPFALALTAINMVVSSWRFLLSALADPEGRSTMHWLDLGVLLTHVVLWLVLPMLIFAPWSVVGFYLLRGALLGFVVFATAAPAHFPAEARFLPTEGHESQKAYRRHSDHVLLQTATTVNFRTGPLGRLLCCGAEFQIEHHLFPGVSHAHYPAMSPVVQRFCEENGYPYLTLGWADGIWRSVRVFRYPKRVEPALEAVRLRALAEELPTLGVPA